MGRDGMDLRSALFGWEAEWSEDVPDANIRVRCGATPSPKISRTGSVPGGTSGERAGELRPASARGSHAGCGGERAGQIQPTAIARASAQPRSGPLPPWVTFGCWRAGEGQLRPADAALRAWEDEEDDACVCRKKEGKGGRKK